MDLKKLSAETRVPVDEIRARWLTLRVALWKADFRRFAKEVIRIRTKDGRLVPLDLNSAQGILHDAAEKQLTEDRWVRLAGLKGRRQGFSTYVAARGYWRAILWDRQNIYILSHEMKSSAFLFDMVDLMQEKNPFPPAVGKDNAKELEFVKRGSSYAVATAGQKAGGRGGATSFFHGSEAAWWTNAPDHFAASVQAVDEVRGEWGELWTEPENPLPFEEGIGTVEGWVVAPSEIWLETTSAGPMGEFYKRYMDAMKGTGRYRAVFVPWIVQEEYKEAGDWVPDEEPEEEGGLSELEYQETHGLTDEQMLWRRAKIHELGGLDRFRQEYPIDVTEAFAAADTEGAFIKPALVLKARKRKIEIPNAPLIVGVDPAGSGGDRFAVCWRRGDLIVKYEFRHKLDHEESVAWLSTIIDDDDPAQMCIDRGSMGANIISTLRNMKPRYAKIIKGVNFGGKSKAKQAKPNDAGPWNIRAEMYARARDWLAEGSIPDEDDLASDLSAPKIKYRANNDWLLESKTEMKARGVRSPDLADAFVLTFAVQQWFETWSAPKQKAGFQTGLTRVEAEGIGDNNGFYEADVGSDYGWMG
jgi:hypothetical protein